MNRRAFFSSLFVGLAAAPMVARAGKPKPDATDARIPCRGGFVRTRPGFRHITDIPPEAGKVNCMTLFQDRIWIGCDNGLWMISIKDITP